LFLKFSSAIVCHSGRDPMAIFMTKTLCRNHKHSRQSRPNLLSVWSTFNLSGSKNWTLIGYRRIALD
jgi:hypothetical protein